MLTVAEDPGAPPQLVSFGADGIFIEHDYDGSVAIGAWEATGASSAALTFVEHSPDGQGGYSFMITIRATIDVSPDGQSFTGQYTIDASGNQGAPQGEYGPGTVSGTRIVVEPMGTPVGSVQDLFGGFEGTEPAYAGTEAAPPATS